MNAHPQASGSTASTGMVPVGRTSSSQNSCRSDTGSRRCSASRTLYRGGSTASSENESCRSETKRSSENHRCSAQDPSLQNREEPSVLSMNSSHTECDESDGHSCDYHPEENTSHHVNLFYVWIHASDATDMDSDNIEDMSMKQLIMNMSFAVPAADKIQATKKNANNTSLRNVWERKRLKLLKGPPTWRGSSTQKIIPLLKHSQHGRIILPKTVRMEAMLPKNCVGNSRIPIISL